MQAKGMKLGIVGGSGMLGSAIARAVLEKKAVAPEDLWISNRSGRLQGFEGAPGVKVTAENQELAEACDVVLLSVPPAQAPGIGITAPDRLVVSVMAGISIDRLRELTGAGRVVRAMSSPAAEHSLAYSPWVAGAEVTDEDRRRVTTLFEACGATDEITEESQIEFFTALTGPVPGFVAFFAKCLQDCAEAEGVAPPVAERAVRQLFLAAGTMMSQGAASPADHVREMIDYAGTTAAGLEVMAASGISEDVAKGLAASVAKTRAMG